MLSDPLPVTTGVPQGSILGPLYFIFFMNNKPILDISQSRIDMYADDSTFYAAGKCMADINWSLTTHSKPSYQWINANHMVLNGDKTECKLLGTRQKLQCATPNFCVYGNNSIVKPVQVHNLFGIYVDSNLSWNTHVSKLCIKLNSRLYLFNQATLLMLFYARKLYFSGFNH